VIVDRIAERIVDRVRLLVGETGGEVLLELLMLGNADAARVIVDALIVADQPFDFEGFAVGAHSAALPSFLAAMMDLIRSCAAFVRAAVFAIAAMISRSVGLDLTDVFISLPPARPPG
jgi:hypothetical protein